MKRTLWLTALALLLALGGGAYWLHGNLDRLVREAVVEQGSAMTGVRLSLDAVALSPTDGRGELHGLTLGNPPGFRTDHALKVEHVLLQLDLKSLTQDVIVIQEIAINAPDLIYEKGGQQTNFDAIAAHIAAQVSSAAGEQAPGTRKPAQKLIVEHFVLRDARAQASAAFMNGKTVSLNLPPVELRDIGKAQGGLSPAELGQVIAKAVQKELLASFSFAHLLKSAGQGLGQAGDAIKGLFHKN